MGREREKKGGGRNGELEGDCGSEIDVGGGKELDGETKRKRGR